MVQQKAHLLIVRHEANWHADDGRGQVLRRATSRKMEKCCWRIADRNDGSGHAAALGALRRQNGIAMLLGKLECADHAACRSPRLQRAPGAGNAMSDHLSIAENRGTTAQRGPSRIDEVGREGKMRRRLGLILAWIIRTATSFSSSENREKSASLGMIAKALIGVPPANIIVFRHPYLL